MSTRRIYMDLPIAADEMLEALATSNGRTKKGQLEFMIKEAHAEQIARDAETTKRDKKSRRAA